MNNKLEHFLLSFIPNHDQLESEDLRKHRLLVSISFITILYAGAFAPVSYIMEYYVAVVLIGITVANGIIIPILLKKGVPFNWLANQYLAWIWISEIFLYRFTGGLWGNPTDPQFVSFIPVIALLLLGRRWAIFWLIIVVLHMGVFGVLQLMGYQFPILMNGEWVPRFVIMASAGHAFLMLILVNVFENTKEEILSKLKDSYKLIALEKKKSEELLLNILPEEAAHELKEKGYVDAQHYNLVTVLFTDFKDFSKMAQKLSPSELVDLINRYYRAFDAITERHGLEKIKTIGDAYMAAGGLPRSNETNPWDVIYAAIDIEAFMRQERVLNPDRSFEVRLGIHTGPVVAGIVGVKKFAYDIWGDTVNTAARMEQNGEAGKINISEGTYQIVKDRFKCTYRGEIEVKGKGKMKMYFAE